MDIKIKLDYLVNLLNCIDPSSQELLPIATKLKIYSVDEWSDTVNHSLEELYHRRDEVVEVWGWLMNRWPKTAHVLHDLLFQEKV